MSKENPMTPRTSVIPTPRYFEPLESKLRVAHADDVRVVRHSDHPTVALAEKALIEALRRRLPTSGARKGSRVTIQLSLSEKADSLAFLNILDRQVLKESVPEQAYILRMLDENTISIVGGAQGVLYGVMTLQQLWREVGGALEIPGVYIRDFPTFEKRAAAGWLLNGECNRWSLDRGQGLDAFETLCKQKLDFCARYKINMVQFDGFGFALKMRFNGYAELMRRLNQYARERGIALVHGGYGAGYGMSYQKGPLYENSKYLGTVFHNRTHYPDGPVYSCMGYPSDKVRSGVNPGELGTCRCNEALTKLKMKEAAEYVRAVEPGGLYIHSEDWGGFDTTQAMWLKRCERCRKRWPNDDATALDGAAGAIGYCFSRLVEAINGVNNSATGYDASRDCTIIFASPLYSPSNPSSEAWHKALTHWQNIARILPPASNVLACFRETFHQTHGATRWVESFNLAMKEIGSKLGAHVYFLCGGDHWCNDNAFVATPAMVGIFDGATAIYNANGNAYQEPQQLFNVECSWNADAADGYLPRKVKPHHPDMYQYWHDLLTGTYAPEEVFGEAGFLPRACASLYGDAAAQPMTAYFLDYRSLPEADDEGERTDENGKVMEPTRGKQEYLPMAFKRVYGVPVHWRRLALDTNTWDDDITNERYLKQFSKLNISRSHLHLRLMKFWELVGVMAEKSCDRLMHALAAGVKEETRPDVEFFKQGCEISALLSVALCKFHEAKSMIHSGSGETAKIKESLARAAGAARKLSMHVHGAFPAVSDPSGGEIGVLLANVERLRSAIRVHINRLAEQPVDILKV
jgi:hypothetical protein